MAAIPCASHDKGPRHEERYLCRQRAADWHFQKHFVLDNSLTSQWISLLAEYYPPLTQFQDYTFIWPFIYSRSDLIQGLLRAASQEVCPRMAVGFTAISTGRQRNAQINLGYIQISNKKSSNYCLTTESGPPKYISWLSRCS